MWTSTTSACSFSLARSLTSIVVIYTMQTTKLTGLCFYILPTTCLSPSQLSTACWHVPLVRTDPHVHRAPKQEPNPMPEYCPRIVRVHTFFAPQPATYGTQWPAASPPPGHAFPAFAALSRCALTVLSAKGMGLYCPSPT